MTSDFDRFTEPGYLAGLAERPLADVRAMRAECQTVENALSLVRRVLHGRLDIVGAEVARRKAGRPAASLAELVDSLPSLLADGPRGDGSPRPPQDIDGGEMVDQILDELGPTIVASASLADLDDERIVQEVEMLEDHERTVSARRHRMHEIIDAIQAEITRRYRTGEATVDSLLT